MNGYETKSTQMLALDLFWSETISRSLNFSKAMLIMKLTGKTKGRFLNRIMRQHSFFYIGPRIRDRYAITPAAS